MRILFRLLGTHVHCKVFTNGKNGDLVFSLKEWENVRNLWFSKNVIFEEEES